MTALSPDAQRYLLRMRSLEPPVELVDSIMAEVESTPQVRSGPDLRALSGFVVGVAAAALVFAVLLRLGTPNVGPAATPVPLSQLPPAGRVEARISMDRSDVPAAFGHGFLWLTNAVTGELIRLDPANGSIASPLQVTSAGSELPITLTETAIWVADTRDGTLVELDPASLEERRRIPVTATISAMAAEGSDLWLLDARAGTLVRIDLADGRTVLSVPTPGASTLLVHAGAVWVADEVGSLARIDPVRGEVSGRVELGIAAEQLVADDDAILVANALDPVIRVDIGAMRVLERGAPAMAVIAQEGRVWAVVASDYLVRLDRETLQPIAARPLDLDVAGTLAIGAGSLWATGVDAAGDTYLIQLVPEP